MTRVIYDDQTPAWAPFALVGIICVAMLWGGFWEEYDLVATAWTTLIVGVLLLLLILAQGRLYWRSDIAQLVLAEGKVDVRISRWVGIGRSFSFAPAEASNWRIIERPASAETTPKKPPNVRVTIRGRDYDLSTHSPKVFDVEGLKTLAPGFFAELAASFPQLGVKVE